MLKIIFCITLIVAFGTTSSTSHAEGLLGGLVRAAGQTVGVKAIEDLGKNADAEHKRIKDNNVIYGKAEEAGSNAVRSVFSLACTATFEKVIAAVKLSCNKLTSQANAERETRLIQSAKQVLIDTGVFQNSEFNGVSIKWCEGSFNGLGITPNSDEVILSSELKSSSPDDVALTLGHEMVHIRQYRSMGTGPFKCNYSQHYVKCAGCQDERHPMEKEAYQYEAVIAKKIVTSRNAGAPIPIDSKVSPRLAAFNGLSKGTFLDDPIVGEPYFSATGRPSRTTENALPPAPTGPPLLPAPTSRPSSNSKSVRDRLVSNRQLSDFANSACTLDGELEKTPSCTEDMMIWLDELRKYVREDYADGERLGHEKYFASFKDDFKLTCTILSALAKSKTTGESHANRCLTRMRSATREIVSVARDKHPIK